MQSIMGSPNPYQAHLYTPLTDKEVTFLSYFPWLTIAGKAHYLSGFRASRIDNATSL